MTHTISNKHLTIDKVNEIIIKGKKLELSKESEVAIVKCRRFLDSKMEDIGRPVYGVTTGFGSLCNITIPAEDLSQLQHNLVRRSVLKSSSSCFSSRSSRFHTVIQEYSS